MRSVALSLPLLSLVACSPKVTTRPSEPLTPPPTQAQAQPKAQAAPARQDWTNGAVVYEVFVRSFKDSNADGKGDLEGLISKLDYLNDGDPKTTSDLGVDAIWLMPVFDSPSYHGYDTTDYDQVNPDYGTNADFERLCREAHKRGIKVVVDLVMNHTGSTHPWFINSASSPTAEKRDWYVWSDRDLGWGQPWNASSKSWHQKNGAWFYGLFWSGMPDLNFRNAQVREEMKRIAAEWLDRGADGFRLDAIRYLYEDLATGAQADLPETHAYLKEFSAFVRAKKPDALLVGEVWTETPIIASYYGNTAQVPGGDELPYNFNFPLAGSIVSGVRNQDGGGIAAQLAKTLAAYPPGATDVPFLTNHDMARVGSEIRPAEGLRSAAAILLTLPGTPFMYYGEEVGMQNGRGGGDEFKRTPMPWDASAGGGFTTAAKPWFGFAPGQDTANVAAQTADPKSLLSRYRTLIRLRHQEPALARGALTVLTPTDGTVSPTLAYRVSLNGSDLLVVHNVSDKPATANLTSVQATATEPVFADDGVKAEHGANGLSVALPAYSSAVLRLR